MIHWPEMAASNSFAKSKPQKERGKLVKLDINSRDTLLLKSQTIRSDRFGKITWVLKIKVVKTPQELAESEPKTYPKHQGERWTNIS